MVRRRTLVPTILLATFATLIALGVLNAQSPANRAPAAAFEVASIKPNRSGDARIRAGVQAGRFTVTNAPTFQIIPQAYDVLASQILNAPDWVRSERYDILGLKLESARGPVDVLVIESIERPTED